MTPRQPARRGKVPNPTNESKDEEEQKARYSVGSTEYFLFFPTMRKEEKEPWQNVYSPPNPSPRGIPTRSATRSPMRCSTRSLKKTPTAAWPARRPSPPALFTSWARSPRAAMSTSRRSRATSSATSATTARSTALTVTPAVSSRTSTSRAAISRWASTTPLKIRKAARASSTTARATRV